MSKAKQCPECKSHDVQHLWAQMICNQCDHKWPNEDGTNAVYFEQAGRNRWRTTLSCGTYVEINLHHPWGKWVVDMQRNGHTVRHQDIGEGTFFSSYSAFEAVTKMAGADDFDLGSEWDLLEKKNKGLVHIKEILETEIRNGDLYIKTKQSIDCIQVSITVDKEPVCECAKEKHGFTTHATYCPLFKSGWDQ